LLRDENGGTLEGRPVAWTTSAPSVALVSSAGVVTAVSAGVATITATVEGKSGTVVVTVPSPVVVLQTDSLLEPGKSFTVRGSGLAFATVMIAGVDAPIVSATDAALTVTVPAALDVEQLTRPLVRSCLGGARNEARDLLCPAPRFASADTRSC
jgi:hypothetical protein